MPSEANKISGSTLSSPAVHIPSEKKPLPHLSDQVAATAVRHRHMEGSALWVLLAMYRAFAVLDRDQMTEVAAMDLTTLQLNILNVLQRVGKPMTMGALAGALVVQPTNLSANFSALSDRGFVKREINNKDRRSLLAVLTKKGEAFLEEVLPYHWERLEQLMADLTKEDRVALVTLLKRLANSIEAHPADVGPKPKVGSVKRPRKPEKEPVP